MHIRAISLATDDEEKASFITPFEIFCYTKMAFRLKNEGATYQKCVHIVLGNQIGRNIEAYIDDIVMKSKSVWICLTTSQRPSTISVSTR
jgi:hypothetical protein